MTTLAWWRAQERRLSERLLRHYDAGERPPTHLIDAYDGVCSLILELERP